MTLNYSEEMDAEFKENQEWALNDHKRKEDYQEKHFPFEKNHLDDNASCDGDMFETYGEDLAFIRGLDPSQVWTYADDDNGNPCICSGYHFVNRIGYFYSEKPLEKGRDIYIKLDF